MSEIPWNRHEMLSAKYKLLSKKPTPCRDGCGALVEWWETTHGRKLLFDAPDPASRTPLLDRATPHWETCTKKRPTPAAPRKLTVQQFAEQEQARLVLVLREDGFSYAAKNGEPADDLRHELITAANEIRRMMEATTR